MIKEITQHLADTVASLTITEGASKNLYSGQRYQNAPEVSTVVTEPFPDRTNPLFRDQSLKTFRVECRGSPYNYNSARDVAQAIHTAVVDTYQILLPVVDSGPKYRVNIYGTEPSGIGPDASDRPVVIVYLYVDSEEES